MTSASFLKSKAFQEREQNVREKVRQASKQDLLADLSRLYGDTTFSDVSFTVCNSEFQAHTVVLRARAPNFCWHFLPRHSSPVSVQTCIQINGLEATEFETFLRSAYTEDDFNDYNKSSYPWRRQKTSCLADEINHVVCETKLKPDNSSLQNDVDGSHGIIQPCCAVDGCGTTTTTVNATESCGDDVKYTQSECGNTESNNSKIAVRDTTDMLENYERAEPQQNNDEDFQTQSVSPRLCGDVVPVNNRELAVQESSRPHVVTTSNTKQENDTLNGAHHPQGQADQKNIDLVNGLHTGVLEKGTGSVCPKGGCDSCTPLSRHLFNGQAEAVDEDIAYKLTYTDAKIVETSFRTKQDFDQTVDQRASDKPSENELESCCCKLGQDLLQLFNSGVGYDVIFLVNGGKVKAHKAILCARSNYFSAMLYGDWIEGKTNEIPLVGVNYNGFMTILKYLYGGITQLKSDSSLICDTLPLVDMYGLEGLRKIIICTLKIDKCHMFHKPCAECLAGVPECLEVSELFSLADLRKSCIKWMAKHFDRVLASKGFATLPKKLQEEILAEIERSFVMSSAIEVLNHCDKLSSCTPLVKWTEPVHVAVSTVQESCLSFISNNFFSMVNKSSFHEILKGVGWSVPVLEKILAAVKRNLTIENCCDQLRAILMLKRIIKLKTQEEGEECYPEEVVDLVAHLHNDCVKFARSNLFKVTRSDGWKRLKYATQREIKEGALFTGFGESGDRSNTKLRSAPPAQASSRPPTRSALRAGTESRSTGLGRGNATVDGQLNRSSQYQRPSSTRSFQGRTAPLPTNKRPSSALPSSAQRSLMLGRGKISSASKGAAENRPLTTWAAGTSGSSRLSAQTTSASGRGKVLPSKSNEPSTRSSCQPAGKFQLTTSNKKNRSVLTREDSTGQPSSAPSSHGVVKKAPAKSKPAVVSGNDKRFTREKPFTVEGSRVRAKNVPTEPKAACVSGTSQSLPKHSKVPIASCNPNKASTSTDCKEETSKKELFKNGTEGLEASIEKSGLEGKSQVIETDSRTSDQVETMESENESNSRGGAQANSSGTANTQDTSELLNEAVGEGCVQSLCHDSPDSSSINDTLELD